MLERYAPKQESIKGSVTLDETGQFWELHIDKLLESFSNIIALRGAGSFNGISKENADKIINTELIPRIQKYIDEKGKVAVIFDGDNDDLNYPDIGYIMGRLRDHFSADVEFDAVQMTGWYKYRDELPKMRPLHSALGNEYQTVLFPGKKFEGEHDHFSQNERLAKSPKYEQWYIGACGAIASKQLADFSKKAGGNPADHRATIFRAPVSIEQEQKIREKIEEGEKFLQELEAKVIKGNFEAEIPMQGESEKVSRLRASIARRSANPYGLLCDKSGAFIDSPGYSNLNIEVV